MVRPLLACLFISVLCSACSGFIPTKKKVLIYNRIEVTNDSLDKMIKLWYQQLYVSTKDKNFSRLRPYRIGVGQFLNRNRSEIANLEINPDGQNLLDSELVFLSGQAMQFSEAYAVFEQYNEMTPNETINGQLKLTVAEMARMTMTKAAINRSLQHYAVKNKLKVKK